MAPPASPDAPSSDAAASEASAAVFDPDVPYAGPLLAGGPALVRLNDHGVPIETLTTGEAIRPRWLEPGKSLLFLRRDGQRWQLVRLELATRAETIVAPDLVGDALRCPGEPPPTSTPPSPDPAADDEDDLVDWLDVHSDWDFGVGHGLACVALMDRNENMADARVQAKVRLADGTVTRTLEIGLHCEHEDPDDAFGPSDPECRGDVSLIVGAQGDRLPEDPAELGPFRVQDGRLIRRTDGRDDVVAGPYPCLDYDAKPTTDGCPVGLPTFDPLSRSPSGRWVVLQGNFSEGDYMHQEWLLLDALRGELFAIADDATVWPAPLTPAQLGALTATGNDMVGESSMFWLSDDRLVIDTRLIVPGEAVVQLPGELAR